MPLKITVIVKTSFGVSAAPLAVDWLNQSIQQQTKMISLVTVVTWHIGLKFALHNGKSV